MLADSPARSNWAARNSAEDLKAEPVTMRTLGPNVKWPASGSIIAGRGTRDGSGPREHRPAVHKTVIADIPRIAMRLAFIFRKIRLPRAA